MSSKAKDKSKPGKNQAPKDDSKVEQKSKNASPTETPKSPKTEQKEDKPEETSNPQLPGEGFTSLEEEIKALRKGLNFSPNFDPTPPAPYPPPAFADDLSFGDVESMQKAGAGRIKVQQIDIDRINSASSVNNVLNNLSPAKLSNSDSSVPRFGFGGSSDPFDVLDSPKNKPAVNGSAQRLSNLGSRNRLESGSTVNKLGGSQAKEASRTSSQANLAGERPNVPPNLSTLGYSLLGVPRNKVPADVLDEFVKQQRQREHDYFTLLNRRFEEESKSHPDFSKALQRRQEELGLSIPKYGSRLEELDQLLKQRGVVECTDVISKLSYVPVGFQLSQNMQKQQTERKLQADRQEALKLATPKVFLVSLAQKARNIRDSEPIDTLPVFF